MSAFVEEHRERFGVEPVCQVLEFAPSTFYAALKRRANPSTREIGDRALVPEIRRVHSENHGVYGTRKTWLQMKREGINAPRCQIERLMRKEGLRGVVRGKRNPRTTCPGKQAVRAPDLVDREFQAGEPNRLWVADFTYVHAWEKTVYVAFVIDVFSRRIVGWRVADSMKTDLVLDAIEMALWARDHEGLPVGEGLIHHSDAGSQLGFKGSSQHLKYGGVHGTTTRLVEGVDREEPVGVARPAGREARNRTGVLAKYRRGQIKRRRGSTLRHGPGSGIQTVPARWRDANHFADPAIGPLPLVF